MNAVMLVGRLAQDIELKTLESGKEVTHVSLAVNRSFKNPDGVYETDFFDCIFWDGLAKTAHDYCQKGDTVGIRGHLQTSTYEKDGVKRKSVEIIVERLTFLTNKKAELKEAGE